MQGKEKSLRRIRFERYATKRVQAVIDNLNRLENCSNKNNYEYYSSDIRKIFKIINGRTSEVEKEFEKQLNKGNKYTFTL
jgi:hypothetical protein